MTVYTDIPMEQGLRVSPDWFISHVFGYQMAEHHINILRHYEESQITLDLAPRGCGKSRVGNIGYCAWKACNDVNTRILILSDTDTHSVRFLNTIKNVLSYSPLIKTWYGDMKGDKWSDHEITTSLRTARELSEATITALGMYSGGVTTGHYNLILADDLANFANTRTPGMRDRAKNWWKTTVLPTLLPGGEIHMLGTRYHFNEIYNMVINEMGYNVRNQPAILDIGTPNERSIWETFMPLHTTVIDGRTVKGLIEIRDGEPGGTDSGIGSLIFNLQYMNNCKLQESGVIFKYDNFRFYSNMRDIDGSLYVEVDDNDT